MFESESVHARQSVCELVVYVLAGFFGILCLCAHAHAACPNDSKEEEKMHKWMVLIPNRGGGA